MKLRTTNETFSVLFLSRFYSSLFFYRFQIISLAESFPHNALVNCFNTNFCYMIWNLEKKNPKQRGRRIGKYANKCIWVKNHPSDNSFIQFSVCTQEISKALHMLIYTSHWSYNNDLMLIAAFHQSIKDDRDPLEIGKVRARLS